MSKIRKIVKLVKLVKLIKSGLSQLTTIAFSLIMNCHVSNWVTQMSMIH